MEPNFYELLGRRLAVLRRSRTGLSQERFAIFVGMDRRHYGRIECGTENPTVETLLRIAAGLGVHPLELFRFPWTG